MLNENLILGELDNIYGQQVIKDMGEVARLYDFYSGKGQTWPIPAGLDYIPTKKRTNIVKKLIKTEARFMFGRMPEIRIFAEDSSNIEQGKMMQKKLSDILEQCSFRDRLIKAARDCFVGKRVALRLRCDEEGISVEFVPATGFIFEPLIDDATKLGKIIFFYCQNIEGSLRSQRIYKQKYELINNACLLSEGIYDGTGRLIKSIYNQIDTGLSFIPARVIINDGMTGDLEGESDVAEVMDNQMAYNRLCSDDLDAIRFNMFPQRVAVDASGQSLKNMVAAPGTLIDLQTDPAAMSGQADMKMLEPSFGYDTRLEHTLTRLKADMYEALSVPNVGLDQLKGVINSGKGLKGLYWELLSRCEEKWATWEDALKWMTRSLVEMIIKTEQLDNINAADFTVHIEHMYPIFEDDEQERLNDLLEVENNVRSREGYIEKWNEQPDSQQEIEKIDDEQQAEQTENDEQDKALDIQADEKSGQ